VCPVCQTRTDIELDVGDTLRIDAKREFKITRQLSTPGEAGMSSVYLAERTDNPSMFGVIKMAKQKNVEALKREAEVLKELQHPNIVRLVHPERAIWQDRKNGDTLHFFALEYMNGGSLKDRLQRQKKFSLTEAVPIILAVGQALQHVHRHGYAHLDVKPANILFSADGRVVLSDFGITRDILELKKLKRRAGTWFYNSPEQRTEPSEHSFRADIYALGVILYEMLVPAERFGQYKTSSSKGSKEPPATPPGARQRTSSDLPPPRQLEPRIPPAVEQVILKAMSPQPGQRYESVAAMLEDLVKSTPPPGGPNKLLVLLGAGAAALIALLLIGLGGAFMYLSSDKAATPTAAPSPTQTAAPTATSAQVVISVSQDTPTPPTEGTSEAGQIGDALTRQPSPTSTRQPTPSPTPPRLVVVKPTLSPGGRLELIGPENNIQVAGGGGVNFQWRWLDEDNQVRGCDQQPPEGYGFQIRVWANPNDPNPPGIRDASTAPACDPNTGIRTHSSGDIKTAPGLQGLAHAEFRWDVAIIELEPPYQATIVSEYRSLYY
jgi:serine/threonine protein kinase